MPACSNNPVTLDMKTIKEIVPNVLSDTVDIESAQEALDSSGYFDDTEHLEKNEVITTFGLESVSVNSAVAAIDEDSSTLYALIVSDDNKKVEKVMNNYFTQKEKEADKEEAQLLKNRISFEVDGILCYVVHSKASNAKELVLKANAPIFNLIISLTSDDIKSITGIDSSWLADYAVYIPVKLQTSPSFFMVLQPLEGKEDVVMEAAEAYFSYLESTLSNKSSLAYTIVHNHVFEKYGNYLIYVASNDNNKVLRSIKYCH